MSTNLPSWDEISFQVFLHKELCHLGVLELQNVNKNDFSFHAYEI
jgi:hypothetical protein